MSASATWRNWAGTASAEPSRFARPASEDEAAALVRAAAETGGRVRAVGAGHSFTPAVVTDGTMISLDHLDRVEWVGFAEADGAREVRVGAGIRLSALCAELARRGLALENMGDIDAQSLAGAISTGTHGTGAAFTGFAAQVRAVRLITPDGDVVSASVAQRPELFEAARLGLGAVGLLTAITMRCVPAFGLRAVEAPMPLGQVLESLAEADGPVATNEHFEFYWFPYTEIALTKANNRVRPGDGGSPLPTWRRVLDDEVLSNGIFNATNALTARLPVLTPTVNRVASRLLTARTYTASSAAVFTSPRRVVFKEMEYALPVGAVVPALREVDAWVRGTGENVPFPVEVRFAAADDVWLSTAHGRPTGYIAVHQFHTLAHERYFRAVEDIMIAHDGRPHWGKMHRRNAAALADLYPRFADFLAVRDAVDPRGLFANCYTDTVFGPAAR
ncbi:D-arabinono-1,4-lactone oxidase [Occultella aeris]|uniref:L-gulono-1,4-lactone dehydrogenase n=1 Tax=Occultella aeris TaxID=2761496 RepID=A0A7M4DFV6_9MICO|nr:D-arabinono-1,4-lactone oxidase [Occultella aeris]VZO35799.1 L-gulono-1,4-lactone dehydrogenase [Occultella aeris]